MATNSSPGFSFVELSFGTTRGPDWRRVYPGLNIEGRCQNQLCKAYNGNVWISKGFFKGCALNTEVDNLKCPICSRKVDNYTVFGLGIHQCNMHLYSRNYEGQSTSVTSYSSESFQYMPYQHKYAADYIVTITTVMGCVIL